MFVYQVVEERFYDADIGKYISFGLIVLYTTYGEYREIMKVSDISTDRERVELLADRCRRYQLHPIHLMDVIEDFIG